MVIYYNLLNNASGIAAFHIFGNICKHIWCSYSYIQMGICNSNIHSPATLLGTPVQLLTQIANQPITRQQVNAFWHLDVVKTTCWSSNRASKWVRNGNLSGFEHRMVVGARQAGLSISKTADLLQFSRTIISRVFREWSEKENISSERQLCGRKCLVDVRGQRRMGRLVRDDRKETVTQITTRYNQGMQNTISERTTRRTLK